MCPFISSLIECCIWIFLRFECTYFDFFRALSHVTMWPPCIHFYRLTRMVWQKGKQVFKTDNKYFSAINTILQVYTGNDLLFRHENIYSMFATYDDQGKRIRGTFQLWSHDKGSIPTIWASTRENLTLICKQQRCADVQSAQRLYYDI